MGALVALLGLAACAPSKPPPSPPDPCGAPTVTVNAGQLCGWAFRSADINGGVLGSTGGFVAGPDTPPLGGGSGQLNVGEDTDASQDAIEFRNGSFAGTKLADLTKLEYSTFTDTHPNNTGQAVYLTLRIDKDGNGTDDETMFFEPVYQTGGYGTVEGVESVPNQCPQKENCAVVGEWQTWDALAGGWWIETGGPPLDTIAHYVSVNPEARIANSGTLGGVRLAAGYGTPPWADFVGNADALTINGKTFNFEN